MKRKFFLKLTLTALLLTAAAMVSLELFSMMEDECMVCAESSACIAKMEQKCRQQHDSSWYCYYSSYQGSFCDSGYCTQVHRIKCTNDTDDPMDNPGRGGPYYVYCVSYCEECSDT